MPFSDQPESSPLPLLFPISQLKYQTSRWRTSKFESARSRPGLEAVVGLRGVRHVVLAVARGVDRVRPVVVERRGEPLPAGDAQARLQRVVARARGRLELVDVEEVGIRALARRRIRLVDGAEAEELAARRADVADLQRGVRPELALHVDVVVLDVRRAQPRVDRPDVGGAPVREDGLSGHELRRGREAVVDALVVGDAGIEGVPGDLADEEVLREGVVVEALACAQQRAAVADEVVDRAHARAEVVPVLVVERTRADDAAARGVEAREPVLRLAEHAVVVPAQAVVQRQAPRQLVVVLEVEAVVVLERLAVRVAARLPASRHAPGHEVVEASRSSARPR